MKYRNRDGNELVFQEIYKLKIPAHTRFGFNEDSTEIEFIDPPGGPFIEVGREFDKKVVTKIEESGGNVLIYFKKES